MARFVRLRKVVVNLDAVAVIRPEWPDNVTLITTLGYTERLEGEDAVDFLAFVFREAVTPVNTVEYEQLAHAWLNENAAHVSWEEERDE